MMRFVMFLLAVMAVQTRGFENKSKILISEGEKLMEKMAEKKYEKLVLSVRDGVNLGLKQCRELFKFSIWNCAIELPNDPMSILPVILTTNIRHATRETAFLNSIIAAGVIYALARDCRLVKFKYCRAHNHVIIKNITHKTGCSKDIRFGEVMAKPFLEVMEGTERNQLILHNNEVGRKAVRLLLRTYCHCHGPTQSCVTKTCWPKLAPFKEIGKYLKEKYKNAKRVRLINNKLQEEDIKGYKPVVGKDQNMFFTESSPDYCQRNLTVGTTGVLDRVCEGSKKGLEQCRKMCQSCAGLKAVDFKEVENVTCDCEFVWCCNVTCRLCRKPVSKIRCILTNDVTTL